MSNRKFSKDLVDGPHQAASRLCYEVLALKQLIFKPLVGIGSKVTPCNMHINELAELVEQSIDESDCKGVLFNTIMYQTGYLWELKE